MGRARLGIHGPKCGVVWGYYNAKTAVCEGCGERKEREAWKDLDTFIPAVPHDIPMSEQLYRMLAHLGGQASTRELVSVMEMIRPKYAPSINQAGAYLGKDGRVEQVGRKPTVWGVRVHG